MRRALLRLLGGVDRKAADARVEVWRAVALEPSAAEDRLRSDLARVTEERDAERVNANEWLTKFHDAEKRIADLEAKLAEATGPVATAERRYAQAWWAWYSGENVGHVGDSNYSAYRQAEDALEAAYAAEAARGKGEG